MGGAAAIHMSGSELAIAQPGTAGAGPTNIVTTEVRVTPEELVKRALRRADVAPRALPFPPGEPQASTDPIATVAPPRSGNVRAAAKRAPRAPRSRTGSAAEPVQAGELAFAA